MLIVLMWHRATPGVKPSRAACLLCRAAGGRRARPMRETHGDFAGGRVIAAAKLLI